jgi:hypothetical protein
MPGDATKRRCIFIMDLATEKMPSPEIPFSGSNRADHRILPRFPLTVSRQKTERLRVQGLDDLLAHKSV